MPLASCINRRGFLAGSTILFGNLATRGARGQPITDDARRAAVVIGLNSYPDLPQLNASVAGAEEMAAFLAGEGFEVVAINDRGGEVRAYQVADAVEAFVRRGTLDQLLIYFSGHGTMAGTSEHWLLSGAPFRSAEAISVDENFFLARRCGIPNIVIVSDACRSVPQSLGLSSIVGQPIFPGAMNTEVHVDVDLFFAALPGAPALELPVEESVQRHEAIFTAAFLKAFREPDRDMIYTLDDGLNVIPNRRLRKFLVREVQARAQARSIRLKSRSRTRW